MASQSRIIRKLLLLPVETALLMLLVPSSPCLGQDLEDLDDLQAITVSARRTDQSGTVTNLWADDLDPSDSLDLSLSRVPAMDVNYHPKLGASFQLRGLGEQNVLLLVDGVPLRESYGGHFDLTSISSGLLSRIRVERGVTSMLRGPGTAGGVIQLETIRPDSFSRGKISLSAGNPDSAGPRDLSGSGTIINSWDWVFLGFGVTHQRSRGYQLSEAYQPTPENASFHEAGGMRDGSDFNRSSITARSGLKLGDLEVNLVLHGFTQERSIPPFESSDYVRYWKYTDYDTLLGGISFQYRGSRDQWSLAGVSASLFGGVHQDTLTDFQDSSYSTVTTNPLAWFRESSWDDGYWGVRFCPTWLLWQGNHLSMAVGLDRDKHSQRDLPVPGEGRDPTWGPWDRFSASLVHLALEDSQRLGEVGLTAGLGVSGQQMEPQELGGRTYPTEGRILSGLEARVLATWQARDNLRVHLTGGRKVRYPLLKELYSNFAGGNPELEPEQTWLTEAGIDLDNLPLAGTLELRLFHNWMRELIQKGAVAYGNISSARARGLELGLNFRLPGGFRVNSWYALVDTRDDATGRVLDYRARHSANVDLVWRSWFDLSAGITAGVRSGQEAWYFESVGGQWVHESLPGYMLLDARLSQLFIFGETSELEVSLTARNLLDANWVVGSFEPRPGRSLMAGLQLNF